MLVGPRRLLLVASLLILNLGAAPTPQTATAPARRPVSTTQPSDGNKRSRPQWYADCDKRVADMKGKPCDIIFIGDSITENFIKEPTVGWDMVGKSVWDKHYATRNALDFGVGADRTEHVLWRFDNMDIKSFDPKVAVILIGTNNNINTPEEIAAGVKAVAAKTQDTFKHAKIILISILPNARATQKMEDANKLIKPLADEKTIFYFDLAAKMTKEGDTWKGLGRDNLHLTTTGYEMWATEMEPLLTKLLESK